jgi:hypothetical protein
MSRGKDARQRLLGLVLFLSCVGCRGFSQRPAEQADLAALPAPPRRTPDVPPARPLCIPGDPTAPPSGLRARSLESPPLLASAAAAPVPAPPLQPGPASLPPLASTLPAASVTPFRRLAQQAAASYAAIDGYAARLRQREQVGGKDHPEEVMLVKFRKEPWSIYLKWVGVEARGREVVHVPGRFDGKIHTRLAAGDVPLMPAGMHFAVAPDSILARGRSRYPISEASLGTLVYRFSQLVTDVDRGDRHAGTLAFLGVQRRPEFAAPVEGVDQIIPPGREPLLPRGGRRLWCFAPDSHLPVLVRTRDHTGHEVEYYCYDQLRPARFTDADFNPDLLWASR